MRRQRIIIDASGAPAGSGGMQLYAREMLRGWLEFFPEDNILIFGPRWLHRELALQGSCSPFIEWPNHKAALRIVGQTIVVPLVFFFFRRTRLLALNSVASPFISSERVTVINHDWRHLRNPSEFSRMQKIYRRLWVLTGRKAKNIIAVSTKTLRESKRILSREDIHLVSHGNSHPRRWALNYEPNTGSGLRLVTFGHQSNKRPWLVVESFIRALESSPQFLGARLTVLGLDPDRMSARHLALARAHPFALVLPGFVGKKDYQEIISGASLIVLASSDEGFGFPAIEAGYFGIPCLVSNDSGLREIHGDVVTEAAPNAEAFSQAMIDLLATKSKTINLSPVPRPWSEVVTETRTIVLS